MDETDNKDRNYETITEVLEDILIEFQKKIPGTVYALLFEKWKRNTYNLDWIGHPFDWNWKLKDTMHKIAESEYPEDELLFWKYYDRNRMAWIFERVLALIETEINLLDGYTDEPKRGNKQPICSPLLFFNSEFNSIQINLEGGKLAIAPVGEQIFLFAVLKEDTNKPYKKYNSLKEKALRKEKVEMQLTKGLRIFEATARRIKAFLKRNESFFRKYVYKHNFPTRIHRY